MTDDNTIGITFQSYVFRCLGNDGKPFSQYVCKQQALYFLAVAREIDVATIEFPETKLAKCVFSRITSVRTFTNPTNVTCFFTRLKG